MASRPGGGRQCPVWFEVLGGASKEYRRPDAENSKTAEEARRAPDAPASRAAPKKTASRARPTTP